MAIKLIKEMPLIDVDEVDLGSLADLNPDFWQNVSPLLKGAFNKIIDHLIDHRYFMEELKVYAQERIKFAYESISDQVARNVEMREKYDERLEAMEIRYNVLMMQNAEKVNQLDEFMTRSIAEINLKVSGLEDADALKEYSRMQGEQAKQLAIARSNDLRQVMDSQYEQLVGMHLRKENLIGPGDECKYKTIIEFMEKAVAPREIIDEMNQ